MAINFSKTLNFLLSLAHELALNGKLLLSYVLLNVPELNDLPMLKGALEEAFANPSFQNILRLAFQIFFFSAAGSRTLKVVRTAIETTQLKQQEF